MPDLKQRLDTALAGRYTVEREVGRGGMATVYLAQDKKHRRRVAVKILHPHIAANIGTDRFLREIEIAARLSHPHILTLIDSGEADRSEERRVGKEGRAQCVQERVKKRKKVCI